MNPLNPFKVGESHGGGRYEWEIECTDATTGSFGMPAVDEYGKCLIDMYAAKGMVVRGTWS